MTTYVTADTHLRSNRQWVVETINSVVREEDNLVIVGDFADYDPSMWRNQLRVHNAVLVLGNHDDPVRCREAFGEDKVHSVLEISILGKATWCSHYAHLFWPKSYKGSFHLFGDAHDERSAFILEHFPGIRSMDVGLEAAHRMLGVARPFSDIEIHEILFTRTGHDFRKDYIHRY